MTWLLSFLSWLFGKLFGSGPSAAETAAKEGESAGMARQQAADASQAAQSEARVAQAEAEAPRTIDGAIARAQRGEL